MFDFGQLLKGYRTRASLTREELAEQLGVAVRTLFSWEEGIRLPRKSSRQVLLHVEEILALSHLELDGLLRAARLAQKYGSSQEELASLWGMAEQLHDVGDGVARVGVGVDELLARVKPAIRTTNLHTLRAPVPDFTGRADDIQNLVAHLSKGGVAASITGIQGMGGIGKTELALVVAGNVADRFPDAALQFELQPGDVPLSPEALLAAVIRAFQPEVRLPEALSDLQGLYRSTLSGRRGILLLDNADGPEQVRALLPAPPGWVVIVTSRARFPLPGAMLHDVDLLPLTDAAALLRLMLFEGGRHDLAGADLEPLAGRCGRLPLALRLAAGFLTTYSDWSLPDYLAALGREPLKRLAAPGETSLQAVLGLSITRLRERDTLLARRWEELAVFPTAFDRAAAAKVWGELGEVSDDDVRTWPELAPLNKENTQLALSALLQQSLLDYNEASATYAVHDLLRQCALSEPVADLDSARYCHAWHYLRAGSAADDLYMADSQGVMAGIQAFRSVWPHLSAAWRWLSGRSDTIDLRWLNAFPGAIAYLLEVQVSPRDRIPLLESALAAARTLGDHRAEGNDLGNLGSAYAALGETRRAIGFHQQALVISRETGYRRSEGASLGNLGNRYAAMGETRRAIGFHEQALAVSREMGDRYGEVADLGNLGNACAALGEIRRAIEYYEQTLAISQEIGYRRGEGAALGNLGNAYAALGETGRAIGLLEHALVISQEIGYRRAEGNDLGNLGNRYLALGENRRAIGYYELALAIRRETGDRRAESNDLGNLGSAYAALGEPRRAIEYYEQALAICRETGDRRGEGGHLSNLGIAFASLGETQQAIEYGRQALHMLELIESPHAAMVRGWLAQLDH